MTGKRRFHRWIITAVCIAILTHSSQSTRIRRVVGGEPLTLGTMPWLVSLHYKGHHEYLILQGLRHLCGGTLIDKMWVLTAGHCVHPASGSVGLGEPENWTAVLGEYNRKLTEEMEQHIEIDKIFMRNYTTENVNLTVQPRLFDDIALLKLKTPAQLNENVGNVSLDTDRSIIPGTVCTVAGWGQYKDDGQGDPQFGNGTIVPHMAKVKAVSLEFCQAAYNGMWPIIDERVICFNSDRNQDTCKGDSGGPLICQDAAGQPVLTGVVSVGMGCALPEYPGVYTRVSAFRDWIVSTMENF